MIHPKSIARRYWVQRHANLFCEMRFINPFVISCEKIYTIKSLFLNLVLRY